MKNIASYFYKKGMNMLKIEYELYNEETDVRQFKNREYFFKWLHVQLSIEPIILIRIEES